MDAAFSYGMDLLYVYLNIRIIRIFLAEKKRHPAFSCIMYLTIVSMTYSARLVFFLPELVTLQLFLLLYLYAFYHFEGTLIHRLAVVSVSIGMSSVSKGIIQYLYHYSDILTYNQAYCSMMPCILILALIMVWEHFFRFDKSTTTAPVYQFQIIFIALSSIVLCEVLVLSAGLSPIMISTGFSIVCLINILTLVLYDRLNTLQQHEVETRTLEQRVVMYQNQFEMIQQSQDELRSLRHDLKNHLLLIMKYIEIGKADSAVQYIQEITQTHGILDNYINTGNDETDCVLNYLLGLARQMECEIRTSIKVPAEAFMPALDLNILISNLLTNAIEAMQKCERKSLNITIRYDRSLLYISVYNTYQGALYKQNRYYHTTKKDASLHGYGFKNMNSIIEKYQGNAYFRTEDDIFKADIILYINPDSASPSL